MAKAPVKRKKKVVFIARVTMTVDTSDLTPQGMKQVTKTNARKHLQMLIDTSCFAFPGSYASPTIKVGSIDEQ